MPCMASKFRKSPCILIIPCFISIMVLLSSIHVAAQASLPFQPDTSLQHGFFQSSFNPSMAIIVIALIAVIFSIACLSMCIRRCTGHGLTGTGRRTTDQVPIVNRRPKLGLDPKIIESLPTMLYSEVKEHKMGKAALECAICLSEFEDDETLRLIPVCSHVFHHDCIDAWLAGHVTCPVCRYCLADHKEGEMLMTSPDGMTMASENPHDTTIGTTWQIIEDRPPMDPPALTADTVVDVKVNLESDQDEERREREEPEELARIGTRRRALMRSKSSLRWRRAQFPRSHSTPIPRSSDNITADRYTLRIPYHVLWQIIADGKLKRTMSLLLLEDNGRGGRSVSVLVRNLSEKYFSSWGITGRRGDGN